MHLIGDNPFNFTASDQNWIRQWPDAAIIDQILG